jgi:copper chaperone
MNKLIYLLIILFFASCQSGNQKVQDEKSAKEPVQLVETTINIRGMHCENCVASVNKGVNELEGIVSVEVSLNDSNAVVAYDGSKVQLAEIEKAIESRGYSIKPGM